MARQAGPNCAHCKPWPLVNTPRLTFWNHEAGKPTAIPVGAAPCKVEIGLSRPEKLVVRPRTRWR